MRQKSEKIAKICEKVQKMTKNGPNKERHQNDDALRVPSSRRGEALPTGDLCVITCGSIVQHAEGRTPAHWDAPRGFARQRGGPDIEKLAHRCPNLHMRGRIQVQNQFTIVYQNFSKMDPKSFQILPKSYQIPPKIDPKSIQKPSWSPSWANARKKLDFERPKNGQEAAKSAQKRPKAVPNSSQMEPKTLPKPIFGRFLEVAFLVQNLH